MKAPTVKKEVKKEKMVRLTAYFTVKQKNQILKAAKARKVTASTIIREMVK